MHKLLISWLPHVFPQPQLFIFCSARPCSLRQRGHWRTSRQARQDKPRQWSMRVPCRSSSSFSTQPVRMCASKPCGRWATSSATGHSWGTTSSRLGWCSLSLALSTRTSPSVSCATWHGWWSTCAGTRSRRHHNQPSRRSYRPSTYSSTTRIPRSVTTI